MSFFKQFLVGALPKYARLIGKGITNITGSRTDNLKRRQLPYSSSSSRMKSVPYRKRRIPPKRAIQQIFNPENTFSLDIFKYDQKIGRALITYEIDDETIRNEFAEWKKNFQWPECKGDNDQVDRNINATMENVSEDDSKTVIENEIEKPTMLRESPQDFKRRKQIKTAQGSYSKTNELISKKKLFDVQKNDTKKAHCSFCANVGISTTQCRKYNDNQFSEVLPELCYKFNVLSKNDSSYEDAYLNTYRGRINVDTTSRRYCYDDQRIINSWQQFFLMENDSKQIKQQLTQQSNEENASKYTKNYLDF
ncbi:uncharacterized protein LOC109602132 isoform X2 [Aethina tumida]|uniref:uncharacterized protein LOC109602132 isoform X2 n=1 Tax=Aethina tumida TaxID=116153 RepID=UPI002147B6CF|nr:uncharacterized protein LOC109602132 isoform X2 [Aethina tumida]